MHGVTDDCCVINLWGLDYPVGVAYLNWRILPPTPALLMVMIMTEMKEDERFIVDICTYSHIYIYTDLFGCQIHHDPCSNQQLDQ